MKLNRSVREIRQVGSSGNCERARIIYIVSESPDAAAAVEAVRLATPDAIGDALRVSVGIISSPGGGLFEVAADYESGSSDFAGGRNPDRNPGDRVWRFSVNSTPGECRKSLHTVNSFYYSDAPRIAPGTRINWNGKTGLSSVSGSCRILEARFTEICRATFRASRINTSYKRRAANLVGKVNSTVFNRWNPGEVLLESITQGEIYTNSRNIELCDLVFTFAIRPNGDRECAGHTIPAVDGWDYLWQISDINPGESAETLHSLHISRIYERASFNALEI